MHGGGVFCKHCLLFARESSDQGGPRALGLLISRPLSKFKKALEVFNAHGESRYHLEASDAAELFLEWSKDKTSRDVKNRLSAARSQRVLRNRKRPIPIIKTVILCGRQNIPLRGHQDQGKLGDTAEDANDGHFRALLRYRLDTGDKLLEEHLINAGFQDDRSVIREVFLKFCDVVEKTGAGLARTILDNLREEGLDVRNLRGQGYDGCSSMSGQYKGVQAQIKAEVPKALYFHCASHCLNLALVHSSEIVSIRLAAGVVGSTCNFFTSSSARIRLLEDKVETEVPTSRSRRLKTLCATRWVESHHAFIKFRELLIPIVHSLRELSQERGDTGVRAYQLVNSICRCDFLVSLFIIESFSSLFLPLSINLQARELDISAALAMLDSVQSVLKQRRENADTVFSALFDEAEEICLSLEVDVRSPRICSRQIARENHPAETAEDYFRVSSYLQYLDGLIEELQSLFADLRQSALEVQCLVPKFTVKSSFEDLIDTTGFYEDDLECSPSIVRGEFERWQAKWVAVPQNELPGTAIETLNKCSPSDYPKIALMLQIFATFPVTTASAERTFSALRLVKTYLRSKMGGDRLKGLASMNIQRDVLFTTEEMLDVIALDPRKIELVL
ncbi:zinc finger MYM-type protein 1-like [Galendromus occidentalis]|uniref:Zinc finger MYM-type protein 1-like n=1 Tax=Galendromus occidentalis TaxID=34638 RepID=A0AAJ7SEB0_9ACAR|nr:zinc finger MYM-type protein 1-like [Galendromus occidentalis]